MPQIVFLRAVNIGGHQTFQPSELARDLAALDIVNIGAAGTFVVRNKITEGKLRKEILARLPFTPELMICPADEILSLRNVKEFKNPDASIQRYVTIMAKAPAKAPRLPISAPEEEEWQVRVVALTGRYVLSLRRAGGKSRVYPNEIVEKRLGITATTRNWTTIAKIYDILAQ